MRSALRIALLVIGAAIASPVVAVTLGETDTFPADDIEGWSGPFPEWQPGGGPGGASDAFLRIGTSGFMTPPSPLLISNANQWAGDYLAAGMSAIEMDLINLGTTDVTMRLLFEDLTTRPSQHIAATSFGALLPAGSGWTHVRFAIAPDDLVEIAGNAAGALANNTALVLYHSATPTWPPPNVTALVGVDNISAVPEPSAYALMAIGLVLVGMTVRRRCTRTGSRL